MAKRRASRPRSASAASAPVAHRTTASRTVADDAGEIPAVGPREPCPCGSGRRYKACHGRAARAAQAYVARPFEDLPGEVDWVALREFVPAATATVALSDAYDNQTVTLATLLPFVAAGLKAPDGTPYVGLQVQSDAGDPSREYASVIESVLPLEPGSVVAASGKLSAGVRLQDILAPGSAPAVTMHTSFGYWLEAVADEDGTVAAGVDRANEVITPTERIDGVAGAYWCDIGGRRYLRWVRPEPEDALVDAFARLHVRKADTVGDGSRHIGAFRAHGLLVNVWELPADVEAAALAEPLATLDGALADALADTSELTAAERSARSGLLNRQRTLRSG